MESNPSTDMRTDEHWQINDDGGANWAMDKIRENNAERDRMIAWYKRQIELAQDRCAHNNAGLEYSLQKYMETVPARETKTQYKHDLPNGALILHKSKQDFAVDKPALLEHLKQSKLSGYIKVEETPMWGEYKKRLVITDDGVMDTETGEFIDCVGIEGKPERFEVKL